MVSTRIRRASLDDAWDASGGASPATSLRTKLREYETAARQLISTGQIISNVAARDRSTSFSIPDRTVLEGLTPMGMVDMWRSLIDLFDTATGYLGGTPTDLAVKNEMMGLLQPVHELEVGSYETLRMA